MKEDSLFPPQSLEAVELAFPTTSAFDIWKASNNENTTILMLVDLEQAVDLSSLVRLENLNIRGGDISKCEGLPESLKKLTLISPLNSCDLSSLENLEELEISCGNMNNCTGLPKSLKRISLSASGRVKWEYFKKFPYLEELIVVSDPYVAEDEQSSIEGDLPPGWSFRTEEQTEGRLRIKRLMKIYSRKKSAQ
jgi:hypothetical protein